MYLGIDYGKKRIGLALGQVIPKAAGVIDGSKEFGRIISDIEKICLQNEVEGIVIGLPKKASGDLGEMAGGVYDLAKGLETKLNLPVYFEEEEFTSVEAERLFKEHGIEHDRKSGKVDELAAILILEQHLNKSSNRKDE